MIKRDEPQIIKKYQNPYFWLGLAGVIFGAAGIDLQTLTSWELVFSAIMKILENPVSILSVAAAVTGVIVSHNTPGRKDCYVPAPKTTTTTKK